MPEISSDIGFAAVAARQVADLGVDLEAATRLPDTRLEHAPVAQREVDHFHVEWSRCASDEVAVVDALALAIDLVATVLHDCDTSLASSVGNDTAGVVG